MKNTAVLPNKKFGENFWFQKKITSSGKLRIKICKIPVFEINKNSKFLHLLKKLKVLFNSPKVKAYYKALNLQSPEGVVYTCITGNYDELQIHKYINPRFLYVCYTDNQRLINKGKFAHWQIRPLVYKTGNNQENNRWHKLKPHMLFPEYPVSVYVDGNINILTPEIFDKIALVPTDDFISVPKHFERDCIYDEAEACKLAGKDTPENINRQILFYRQEGFPRHFGLGENNIIFRRHNLPKCKELMEQWWTLQTSYSRRDQLGLFYLLWKNRVHVHYLTMKNPRFDFKNFKFTTH